MELFEFKRYLGDDNEFASGKKSVNKIEDYLGRVKERKRLREEDTLNEQIERSEATGNEELNLERKPKKKKKQAEKSDDALTEYLKGVRLRRKRRERVSEAAEGEFAGCSPLIEPSEEPGITETLPKKPREKVKRAKVDKDTEVSDKAGTETEVTNKDVLPDQLDPNSKAETSKKKNKKKKKKKKKVKKGDDDDENLVDLAAPQNEPVKEVPAVKFEVLGAHSFQNKVKVKRVLPRWLAEPTVILSTLSSNRSIKTVGKLHKVFISNLESKGVSELFPVQLVVIPYQLKCFQKVGFLWPRDLCVSAPTGSGKTLAYVLPILQAYFHLPKSDFYALVVVPVQELAIQVAKVFTDVAKGSGIKIGCVTGGRDRDLEAKNLVFKRNDGCHSMLVNILVATPGRLMEHFFLTPGFSVKHLKFIVIDEADRVVEQKSLNWLHLIEKDCNPSFNGSQPPVTFHNLQTLARGPQKLLFSATLSQDPEKLLKLNLFQPKLITSVSESKVYGDDENQDHFYGKFTTPATLVEKYVVCEADKKPLLVYKFLKEGWRRVLIFTKSCVEANRLFELLKLLSKDIKIEELTSNMILGKRQLVVEDFSRGSIDVLVCSDRMARGMDIRDVNYVLIYDPPKYAKGYIHKAGRTGRAGKSGTAVTILTPKQSHKFIQKLAKAGKADLELIPFQEEELDELTPAYEEALVSLKSVISSQKTSQLSNLIKEKRTKIILKTQKKKKIH